MAGPRASQWVGTKQKELDVNAFQLLSYQAPMAAGILLFVIPVLEPPFAEDGLFMRSWSTEALVSWSAPQTLPGTRHVRAHPQCLIRLPFLRDNGWL